MPTRYVSEKSALAPKNADGTYPIVIIDEGTGSSGIYSAELLKKSEHIFENAPSYANHPVDPSAPHLRDVNTIAGRVLNVRAEERDGKMALVGDFKARKEYASLIEEFGDILGASIFCAANGKPDKSGRIVVESFAANDPYTSVDIVVAAGRGGRFERASESLRAIESSLGLPAESQEREEQSMEIKELADALAAFAESMKPVIAFVTEESARRQAEAEAAGQQQDAAALADAIVVGIEAVKAAKLPSSLEKPLVEAVKRGEDVSVGIESAKVTVAEIRAAAIESAAPRGYVHESGASADTHDYTISRLNGVN